MHFLLSVLFIVTSPQNVSLQVSSTAAAKGDFHLAVYASAADYEARRPLVGAVKACNDDVVGFEIDLPSAGDYVISGYHDLNGNGKLDFNMMGIPKEPYGFVRPPVSKWKEPQFEEIATSVDGGKLQAKLDFKLWKEY
ncbi:DUF2141 domain-containing protein [Neolewinella aurantiaca]|uniref:DUF2141 domain-containing protein n=1 Tax=Neolewinella aurantiaca TaxID=2602767 RepID=A0A5C7FY76_9BACT|nr:DUF2141 domain-containing protein [Neolewinella aurantiaca]TXF90000.1 DUF2141 domain-containing protein [Neolewinella aurantiaca]